MPHVAFTEQMENPHTTVGRILTKGTPDRANKEGQTYGFHKMMVFHAQLCTIKFPTSPYTMKSDG
jgi:hypothetical protein